MAVSAASPLPPAVTKSGQAIEKDMNVCQEDQHRINMFARKNSHLCDLKDQIVQKEKDLQNFVDAEDDIMLSDSDNFLYQIGEVFIHMTEAETEEALKKAKELVEEEVRELKEECDKAQKILSELKIQLYTKFGDNINLETE